jgi:prepilin-type N-terminal cleavage/methylation domain-containing protein
MARHRRIGGFTLIEMLVVSAIIVILVTTTLYTIGGFFKGSSVKEGGRIVSSAFYLARQQAAAHCRMQFLVFDMANSVMTIYDDADRDKVFSKSADPQIGAPMPLPKNIYFDKVFGKKAGTPYAAFLPDGSVKYYDAGSSCTDVSWNDVGYAEGSEQPPKDADIILRVGESTTEAPDKVYCDVHPLIGIVRRIEFFHRTGTTPLP